MKPALEWYIPDLRAELFGLLEDRFTEPRLRNLFAERIFCVVYEDAQRARTEIGSKPRGIRHWHRWLVVAAGFWRYMRRTGGYDTGKQRGRRIVTRAESGCQPSMSISFTNFKRASSAYS